MGTGIWAKFHWENGIWVTGKFGKWDLGKICAGKMGFKPPPLPPPPPPCPSPSGPSRYVILWKSINANEGFWSTAFLFPVDRWLCWRGTVTDREAEKMERSYKVYTSVYCALCASVFRLNATLSYHETVCLSDCISVFGASSLYFPLSAVHVWFFRYPWLVISVSRMFHVVVILYTGYAFLVELLLRTQWCNYRWRMAWRVTQHTSKPRWDVYFNEHQNERYSHFSPAKVTVKCMEYTDCDITNLFYNEHVLQAPEHFVISWYCCIAHSPQCLFGNPISINGLWTKNIWLRRIVWSEACSSVFSFHMTSYATKNNSLRIVCGFLNVPAIRLKIQKTGPMVYRPFLED